VANIGEVGGGRSRHFRHRQRRSVRDNGRRDRSHLEVLAEHGRLAIWQRSVTTGRPTLLSGAHAAPLIRRRSMARDRGRSAKGTGAKDALIEAMADLVGGAKGAVGPLSKRATKEIRKLEKRLSAARATETKRLRQLAAAQGTKGRKLVAKRSKQAGEAAQEVAALAGKMTSLAASAAGIAASTTGGAARAVGTAAVQAVEAVSPIKATPPATPGKPAVTRKPATPGKPAVTRKPATPRTSSPRTRRRPPTGDTQS
jgi:hypothetical protein